MNIYVSILAGGQGTRLWPLSTPERPKPFVDLGPVGSLYEATVRRALAVGAARVYAVGSAEFRGFCRHSEVAFVEEPAGRNTAPAVALSGARAWGDGGGEGVLLVLPADHWIPDAGAFAETVGRLARLCVSRGSLGVMGIRPTRPHTGYGYIQAGAPDGEGFEVERFIEKPDMGRAEALVARGDTSWNSGMFLFPLRVLREELGRHCPGAWEAAEAWLDAGDPAPYLALDRISVDYALMEKSGRIAMVRAEYPWSDVGTYPALHELLPKDECGNSGWGPGRVEECRGCLVVTAREATLVRGLVGQAVVETDAGLLVTPMAQAEAIREGVEEILAGARQTGRRE